MAKVTIETHNVTVQATSGRSTFQVAYVDCTGVTVEYTNANFQLTSLSLTPQGYIAVEWGPNTTGAMRATFITVTANVSGGGTVKDVLALNQQGQTYNISIEGDRDVNGDNGSGSYLITTTSQGTFSANSQSPWVLVNTVQKTAVNKGSMTLVFDRNTGNPRYGQVIFILSFDNYPYNAYYNMVLTQGTYVAPTPSSSSLSYNPNVGYVNYNAGTFTSNAPIMENVGIPSVRNVSGTMNITSVDIDPASGKIIVVYGANNGNSDLSATISVRALGASGYVSASYTIYQGSYQYLVNPIWKTTVVEVAGQTFVEYTISTDGEVIYSGRAYKMPGEDTINFEINEIVRDYIDNYLWWREGYQTPVGWERTFTLELSDGSGGDYIFTKDWSYVEKNYSSTPVICLNDPIINTIPAGCFVPVCIFSPQRAGNTSFTRNGTSVYTANLNNPRQARYLFVSTPGYNYGYSGNNNVYKGAADCKTRYVLYYENAFGGFDALPIQGNSIATDKITAYTTKNAVRVPSRDFAYRRYLNDITKTWKLNTTYLSDEQASKMHHLLESTEVYLYDIQTTEVRPVVIDDTSVEYKTYKNQGRKFFTYTFNVKESQNKIRK